MQAQSRQKVQSSKRSIVSIGLIPLLAYGLFADIASVFGLWIQIEPLPHGSFDLEENTQTRPRFECGAVTALKGDEAVTFVSKGITTVCQHYREIDT
jgi:hypothetical protein